MSPQSQFFNLNVECSVPGLSTSKIQNSKFNLPMLKHESTTGTRAGYAFGAVFVLLAAGIITGGWHAYRKYERSFRTAVEHQLEAIADLKVRELTQYCKERLLDAEILNNPAFAQMVRRFLDHPEEAADASGQLRAWLEKYTRLADYDEVRLMDDQCVTRYAVPAGLEPADPGILRAASEVLQSGRIVLHDFYRDQASRRVCLGVLVPILDESNKNRPLGVLVLRMDPTTYLYPFIQRLTACIAVPEPHWQRHQVPWCGAVAHPGVRGGPRSRVALQRQGQRHRHRTAACGARLRDLPTPAHPRGISRHRHRSGHLPAHRPAPRRENMV